MRVVLCLISFEHVQNCRGGVVVLNDTLHGLTLELQFVKAYTTPTTVQSRYYYDHATGTASVRHSHYVCR